MTFKGFILLGLLFGSVILVSSSVSAETSKHAKKVDGAQEANSVDDAKAYCGCCKVYGVYSCGPRCCWPQAEPADQPEVVADSFETKQPDGYGYGGGGYGGHGGGHGGGGHGGGHGGGGHGGGGWGGGGHGGGGGGYARGGGGGN